MDRMIALLCSLIFSGGFVMAQQTLPQNQIGWSVFQSQSANENLFLSPTSIYVAIAFTFEGSQGESKEQARKFLGLTGEAGSPLNPPVLESLQKLQSSSQIQFSSANQLWTNSANSEIKSPSPDFVETAEKKYQAGIQSLNFQPLKNLSALINNWASEKTNK